MNKEIIKKIALFLGFAIFAGYSAYMTATSTQLKWLTEVPLWLVIIMFFIIALLAGWCLTNAIKEVKNHTNPNKGKFVLSLLGFLILWLVSFTTNVHYNFVNQHGYDNLNKQLSHCVQYLEKNTNQSESDNESERNQKKQNIKGRVEGLKDEFRQKFSDTRDGYYGFGDECVGTLRMIQDVFRAEAKTYGDTYSYSIYNEVSDKGDIGKSGYGTKEELEEKYFDRIQTCYDHINEAIDRHYNAKLAAAQTLKPVLLEARQLGEKMEAMKKDRSFKGYYDFYHDNLNPLLAKMPKDYQKEVASDHVYPSDRMFDFVNVWSDWFSGNLPSDYSLLGKMPLALIFDLVAYVLVAML